MLHYLRVGLRITITQSHTHAMQQTHTHTHTHKAVTRWVEAKKLLSRWRQSEYSDQDKVPSSSHFIFYENHHRTHVKSLSVCVTSRSIQKHTGGPDRGRLRRQVDHLHISHIAFWLEANIWVLFLTVQLHTELKYLYASLVNECRLLLGSIWKRWMNDQKQEENGNQRPAANICWWV